LAGTPTATVGDDHQGLVLDVVDQAVREVFEVLGPHERFFGPVVAYRPGVRCVQDEVDGLVYVGFEPIPETYAPLVVPRSVGA
jgi:hypothetical protein